MNIAIINCPVRTTAVPNNIPLGIYCVGASIKRAFPEDQVIYVDLNLKRPEVTPSEAADMLPEADLYLLSGLITTYRWQKTLCNIIRTKFPGRPIVSG